MDNETKRKRAGVLVGSGIAAVVLTGGLALSVPLMAQAASPTPSVGVEDGTADGETADDQGVEDGTNDGETADDQEVEDGTADGETADDQGIEDGTADGETNDD